MCSLLIAIGEEQINFFVYITPNRHDVLLSKEKKGFALK